MELSLATYNIRNTTDRYLERRKLLSETLSSVDFHLCGLQEVRFLPAVEYGFTDQADELAEAHPGAIAVYRAPLSVPYLVRGDDTFRIDGNCILVNTSSIHVISHSLLELSEVRTAQRICFQFANCDDATMYYSFTNVHLHHQLESVDENIRFDQISRCLTWMESMDTIEGVQLAFLVGDFNAPPNEKAYARIHQDDFRSLHAEYHGAEPDTTFPTGLQAATMDTDPPLAVDYIFCRSLQTNRNLLSKCLEENTFGGGGELSAESAKGGTSGSPPLETVDITGAKMVAGCIIRGVSIFGNVADPMDATVYPSDHVGIFASMILPS